MKHDFTEIFAEQTSRVASIMVSAVIYRDKLYQVRLTLRQKLFFSLDDTNYSRPRRLKLYLKTQQSTA
jgi:hypothetical protein